LTPSEVNKVITVIASYTDGYKREESVTSNATSAVIAPVNTLPTGEVTISGTAQVGQTLTANVSALADIDGLGTFTYQWYSDNVLISSATGNTYIPVRADFEKIIKVIVSYTDGYGTQESKNASTSAVIAPANTLPTGEVTISGTAQVGLTLIANASALTDPDIIGTITYQWKRAGVAITGATNSTYILVQADFEKTITVTASYTDGYNRFESKTSAATLAVTAPPNTSPTGSVIIDGNVVGGQTLTASNTIGDADGLGTISYKWYSDGVAITGATNSTYKLTPAELNKVITVIATYTDGYKYVEHVTSAATSAVIAPVNTLPTGSVTISGTAQVGQTLTAAANTLADIDGLGVITYKWYRSGDAVSIATGTTYVLVRADFEKTITVTASYTDGYGTQESKQSAATSAVIAPANTLPTGSVTISGTAQVGLTLIADSSALIDPDIIGTITYQWKRAGIAIAGATNPTYQLVQADFEKTITVTASYTDGYNRSESKTSAATLAVAAPPNTSPTGSVTISGNAVGGQTLTASAATLADADGLGTISYKWYSDGVAITGATGTTYKLTPAELNKVITVIATYTDGYKYVENVTSAATAAVTAPTNTLPTGDVTISGNPVGGQTLTANVSAIADIDGLGTFTYQWYRAGVAVSNATNPTYILGPLDVNNIITVTVSYTDGYGYAESKSASTVAITAPTNTLPTGSVTISGNTQVGQTLTATVNNLVDPDGIVLPITYKWYRDNVLIPSATNSTYVLSQDDVGTQIKVTAAYTDGYGRPESLTSSSTTIPAAVAPAEPTALTSLSLNVTSTNSYIDISSNIYRVLDRAPIGAAPLLKETSVTTLPFNAPIHRQANNGASGNSTLMTLSASLNGGAGPSVLYTGFPATTPSPATTNNITITPNSVTDYYTGQLNKTGYYLTSSNIITATQLSAGSGVNTLSATQTFSTGATGATASTPFYYDTPVTSAPTCSINDLSISSSTKVSGISIYTPPTGGATPTITIDASASNMGNYFYRSPLITYNYAVNGTAMGPTGESGLGAVNPSDISGNMFKTGTLRFSSTLPSVTDMTRIDISANAYNVYGPSELTGRSFNVITDASSVKFVTQTLPSSIPELQRGVSTVGFRIWSAPSLISPYFCPDLSYNGVLYYTIAYDNSWDISRMTQVDEIAGPTATSYNNARMEPLIKNGLFTTPPAGAYTDYSGSAGNSTINYSGISSTGFRFASFCWKLPIGPTATKLMFTINSINIATLSSAKLAINGSVIPLYYCFQDPSNPNAYGSTIVNGQTIRYYNTVWINANLTTGTQATATTVVPSSTSTVNRFGTLYGGGSSLYGGGSSVGTGVAITGSAGNYTATLPAFIPAWEVTTPIYLYARVGIPMNKDAQFGAVSVTLTT
jgi:hypothetical protein